MMMMMIAKRPRGDQNGRALAVFGTILAIGNAQWKVSHEFFRDGTTKFRSYGELDCGGSLRF